MRARVLAGTFAAALLIVPLLASAASAQNALVVSVWGGNWKDTVEKVIGQGLHRQDGHPRRVRGGRHHRPPGQGAGGQGQPAGGPELHHDPRGAALHLGRALREARHGQAPEREGGRPRGLPERVPHGRVGYVYTVVYRPDLVKEEITKWSDLWKPSLKGKIAMPDFDPSHIITIAALMEGGNEVDVAEGPGAAQGSSSRASRPSTRPTPRART